MRDTSKQPNRTTLLFHGSIERVKYRGHNLAWSTSSWVSQCRTAMSKASMGDCATCRVALALAREVELQAAPQLTRLMHPALAPFADHNH